LGCLFGDAAYDRAQLLDAAAYRDFTVRALLPLKNAKISNAPPYGNRNRSPIA